jgi:hypothetical protein
VRQARSSGASHAEHCAWLLDAAAGVNARQAGGSRGAAVQRPVAQVGAALRCVTAKSSAVAVCVQCDIKTFATVQHVNHCMIV